jgi:hypothetical protein
VQKKADQFGWKGTYDEGMLGVSIFHSLVNGILEKKQGDGMRLAED